MAEDKFLVEYGRLNPEQKVAVDTVEGPVMVVAGPGTGKTQILTLRIANILKQTDTAPEQILALTFTESGVASMRKRLAEMIGSRAYAVNINTFHGFCNDIIKKYPENFPRIVGARNIKEVDQVEILERVVAELPLKTLRPFGDPLLYVRPLKSAIEELKREGLTPAEFAEVVQKEETNFKNRSDLYHEKGAHKGKMKGEFIKLGKEIGKNQELAQVYEAYEAALTKERLYDFSDMIMEVLQAFRNDQDLLQVLQEEHQYILVDEHQDTNNAQNKIIELLMSYHQSPNLFVVGDEKQAIFRFQGASLENFLYFQKSYPSAKLINLTHNYRSSQTILDSAHSLITSPEALRASANHPDKPINVLTFNQEEEEVYSVAKLVQGQLAAGVPAAEVAVLYRDNKDALPIAKMLEKLGVPFAIESDQDLFSQMDVKKLVMILEAVANFGYDVYLAPALHLDLFKLEPLTVYQLIRRAHEDKKSLWQLLKTDAELKPVYEKLKTWHEWSKNLDLLTVFERIVRDAGVLEQILISPEAEDRFAAIRRLYDEVMDLLETHPEASLTDFFHYLETIKKHGLFIKRSKAGGRVGKVRLMTAHRSKGLEFEVVFIIGAYDGHWGGRHNRDLLKILPAVYLPHRQTGPAELDEEDKDSDERRLFYVALTRAKREVYISYSKLSESGKDQLASRFVTEIKAELKEDLPVDDLATDYAQNKSIIFAPSASHQNSGGPLHDREFVKEVFLKQGLSVSALNNYLECPWQYFYRNLIRLPEAQTKHQLYGIAVHAALAELFKQLKERDITKEALLASFENNLAKLPFTKSDYEETLAKGQTSLAGWHEAWHESWPNNVLTEFRVAGVLLTEDIRLTGVLDKIEFLGTSNEVRVVDYKTKKPMTRNAIMGETKTDDDGNYFRQLVFYKLLLDKYEDGKYLMQEGLIDFIEPNDAGAYKRESFTITPEQVKELEEIIKQAAEEILNLAFWDKRCDNKKCDYCHLREVMG